MAKLVINGGKKLAGSITIAPNKNAVLPVLCATLLTEEECIMHHVPKSPDVLKILQAIDHIGGTHHWKDDTLFVCCKNITSQAISSCVADIQSAILFVGPLLARFGCADVPVAIGCKLGYRGPEDHIDYLERLGVSCRVAGGRLHFGVDKSKLVTHEIVQLLPETVTKTFIFSEASVTPTENLLMLLSCVTKFDVEVQGIAQEPHVEFLIKILKEMGMIIEGKGNVLLTKGCLGSMKGFECDFAKEPDHVDFYGTAITSVLTKSDLFLQCHPTLAILSMIAFLNRTGIHCRLHSDGVLIHGAQSSYQPVDGFSRANGSTWKLNPRPWPGFPVDCLPSAIALSASVLNHGNATVLNNWMYEDGLDYVYQMNQLGTSIRPFTTDFGLQKVCVDGFGNNEEELFSKFSNESITIPGVPVIEGTRALFSIALARKGETIIEDISPFLRRSPDFVEKFREIGADIVLVA